MTPTRRHASAFVSSATAASSSTDDSSSSTLADLVDDVKTHAELDQLLSFRNMLMAGGADHGAGAPDDVHGKAGSSSKSTADLVANFCRDMSPIDLPLLRWALEARTPRAVLRARGRETACDLLQNVKTLSVRVWVLQSFTAAMALLVLQRVAMLNFCDHGTSAHVCRRLVELCHAQLRRFCGVDH